VNMQDVEYDYIAKAALFTPSGVRAYNIGDGVSADAVNAFGWQLGTDVLAARPDVIARPAGNARRADWEQYWLGQGAGQDEIDAMTRDEMAHREPVAPGTQPAAEQTEQVAAGEPLTDVVAAQGNEHNVVEEPGSDAKKADWVAYAIARGLDEKTAGDSTIAQLQAFDYAQL
jgi:hypothetical protein